MYESPNTPHKIDWSIDLNKFAEQVSANMRIDQMPTRHTQATQAPKMLPAEPITERGRQHLASLNKSAPTAFVVRRHFGQEMDFEAARKKVWALFQLRAAAISDLENRDFNWDFSDAHKANFRQMIKYFINDASCELNLAKALRLHGMPGTTKTESMWVFERFCKENKLSKEFEYVSMSDLHAKAKSMKDFDPVTPNLKLNRVFDEVGRYIGITTSYGEPLDINEAIFEERYTRFQNGGQLTHIITNSHEDLFKTFFSPVLLDRILHMTQTLTFKGTSKRASA
jgi:hypothetical protein